MSNPFAVIPKTEDEFWTVRQRQMHSLHYVVSYRASFKPELPDYLIRKYSQAGQFVGDPFCGRGTTILQANLLGRQAVANDVNPLAIHLTKAKVNPVLLEEVEEFLNQIDWDSHERDPLEDDLLCFYHSRTLNELLALKKAVADTDSDVSRFVSLVAVSRLHGHSTGFFSAYSMPQLSVTPQAQQRINKQRNQTPEYRPVKPRLLTKAKAALQDNQVREIRAASKANIYTNCDARQLVGWPSQKLDIVITSPPFLNKVDYIADNWLEHWFLGIHTDHFKSNMLQTASLADWKNYMQQFFLEVNRVLKPNGVCIVEVGDVLHKSKSINLDEILADILIKAPHIGLQPLEVLIHRQHFTKLAHCFSVTNNKKGTNTQRMLVMQKK